MEDDFKAPGISTGSLESGHELAAAGAGRPGPCIARSTAGTLQSRSTSYNYELDNEIDKY